MKHWKNLVTYHWRSKLTSLLLATMIWFLIREIIPESGTPPVDAPQTHR